MGEPELLVVDDNELDREQVRRLLGNDPPFRVMEASTAQEGLAMYRDEQPDLVLLDLRLPGVEGMEVLEKFIEHGASVIMLTGQGNESTAVEAMKTGAIDYLVKDDLTSRHLRSTLAHATEVRRRRRSEDYIRALVRGLPYAVFNFDDEGYCLSQVTGAEDAPVDPNTVVGRRFDDILSSEQADEAFDKLTRALESGTPQRMEFSLITPAGPRTFEAWIMRYAADEALAAVRDVTEDKRFEQRMDAARRMEAIGRLAGGVAHDFNNMLTVIRNCVEVLRQDRAIDSAAQDDLACIEDATDRATRLTNQLLTFGRRRVQKLAVVDLRQVVEGLIPMMRRTLGEHIQLETSLDEVWPVRADLAQIEQIVLNLAINARDAMPRGGRLEIETGTVRLDDDNAVSLPPGDYSRLRVTDTGTGIEQSEMQHIFEPFFTTRQETGGTGLGLATVHAIAQQAGGDVFVDSEPGVETTFTVFVPRTEGEPRRRKPATAHRSIGAETILLVEDDPLVRRSTARILVRRGYEVITATTGEEGLEQVRKHADEIAIVLTDVVMPGMSGPEFVRRLKDEQPDTAVVFMSGYTDDDLVLERVRNDAIHFVQKPFSPDRLHQAVRIALGQESADGGDQV